MVSNNFLNEMSMAYENFSKEIWEFRAELNKAYINKDKEGIEKIWNERFKFFDKKYDEMFISKNLKNEDQEERRHEIWMNKTYMLSNIEDIYFKINSQNSDNYTIKFKGELNCVANVLWVARAMYDEVLRKSKRKDFVKHERRCMELMESVIEAFDFCYEHIDNPFIGNNLYCIREEVLNKRKEIFGDKKFIQGFEYISKEY